MRLLTRLHAADTVDGLVDIAKRKPSEEVLKALARVDFKVLMRDINKTSFRKSWNLGAFAHSFASIGLFETACRLWNGVVASAPRHSKSVTAKCT